MKKIVFFVAGIMASVPCFAQDLKIAAASDLTTALKAVTAQYEKKTGKAVKLSFGSSGNFFTQINNGAPFDLFFSADIAYPQKLEEAGLTEMGSLYEYAEGRLVLWTHHGSNVPVNQGLSVLKLPAARKIAIANPQHAPYGRAAVAAMQHEKLYDAVKDKIVFGENISQTAQFASSGNADVGLIALSLARSPQMQEAGTYWLVPKEFHPPLRQAAVITHESQLKLEAKAFLDFLKSKQGQAIMEEFGFRVPGTK